jgi:tetratricopeptide (TPR) repeat protein
LSRVPGITVVSRSDTLPYRDRRKGRDAIARELGATYIVDGTLQRSGLQVRITLSLLRAGSNLVGWSNTYDGNTESIFALQREVAEALGQFVRLNLSTEERRRINVAPTSNSEALADYMQARAFLERPDVKGNLDRAITLLHGAIVKDAQFAWAHASLAEAYWQRYRENKDIDWSVKARDEAAEALRLDGHDAAVRFSVAALYRNTGRADAAAAELRTAITLQPSHDRAHQLLGLILAESGHVEEGLAEIRQAIELRPNYWSHHHALGWVLLTSGRFREAVAAFRRVTELQPDSSWGFNLLGTAYDSMGDKDLAALNYRRSIEASPSANAYSNLGTLYYRSGRLAESVSAFSEALKLDPSSALRHRNLGDAYRKLGESSKARAAYRRAVELSREALHANPHDAATIARLAVYLAKLGEYAEARSLASEAVAIAPTSGDVRYRQAVVLALCGNRPESVQALEAALSHGYSVALARQDDDLSTLLGDHSFQKLTSEPRLAPEGTQ